MIYSGHLFYRVLAALCVVLALVFAWQLYESWDWGELLFLAIAAWCAFRCLILMSSRIEIAADRVRLLVPMRTPREVEFRQFGAVYEEGRGLKSILLIYYPRNDAGIVTPGAEASLALPAVNDHEELLAALSAQVRK